MVIQASAGQRLAHDPEATAGRFNAIAGAAREAEQDMGRLVSLLGDERAIGPAPDLALVEELVARAAGSGLDVKLRLEGEREGCPPRWPRRPIESSRRADQRAPLRRGAPVSVLVRGGPDALTVDVKMRRRRRRDLAGLGTGMGLRGLRERVGACGGTLERGPRRGEAGS